MDHNGPNVGMPSVDFRAERQWNEVFGETLFAFPATVEARTANATLLELAKTRGPAVDPAVFDDHPPFMAAAEVSSNRIDSYFTRMQPSSLQNYAADYTAGVSVLSGHQSSSIFGRTLTGAYAGPQGNGVARATSEFYTIPGLKIGDADSDQMILGIRSGILQDVSNGFYSGTVLCSICKRDIWSWDCPHMPGVRYGADGKRDSSGDLAIGDVENAHSAEFSLVYDGSTPGAGLLKAQQLAATGRMREQERNWVEARYRVHLPPVQTRQWSGAHTETVPGTATEETMTPEERVTELETERDTLKGQLETQKKMVENVRTIVATVKLPEGHAATGDLVETIRFLSEDRARLSPLADDGRAYRSDLIDAALAEGVRAYGKDFEQEQERDMLERSTLAQIKLRSAQWAKTGAGNFPGGRLTTEGEQRPDTTTSPAIPAEAYRAGR